jgi:uncharacterized membrane protein
MIKRMSSREVAAASLLAIVLALLANSLWLWFDIGHWSHDLVQEHLWAVAFADAIRSGDIYPRWIRNGFDGLGEHLFFYYAPLLFYAASLVDLIATTTWRALVWAETGALAVAALSAYLLVRRWSGSRQAVLAAIVVACAPYYFACNYYLVSIPSGFAFAALMMAMASLQASAPGRINIALAVAVGLTVISHTLTGFMSVLCLPWFCLAFLRNPLREALRDSLALWISIALGLGLSLFYLYPALASLSLVHSEAWSTHYADDWHRAFVMPVVTAALFGMRWGSMQWGLGGIAALTLVAATLDLWHRERRDELWWTTLGITAIGWAATLLGSELAYPVWALKTPLLNIQYRFRFIAIMSAAGLSANLLCLAHHWNEGNRRPVRLLAVPLLLSVLAAVALNGKIAVIEPERASRPDELSQTYPGTREYLPRSASDGWKEYIAAGGFQHECDLLGATCREIHQRRTPSWEVEASHPISPRLPLFAFPTWSLRVDNQPVVSTADPATGLITVELSTGHHIVSAIWHRLRVEYIGMMLTVASVLALLAVWIVRRRLGRWNMYPVRADVTR